MTLLKHIYFLVLFACLCTTSSILHAQSTHLGDIIGTQKANTYRIYIQSNNDQVKALAEKAFSFHGAFQSVKKNAHLIFIIKLSGNGVQTSLSNSNASTTFFSRSIQAATWQQATAMACDLVVTNRLGTPGFFSGKIACVLHKNRNGNILTSDFLFQAPKKLTNHNNDSVGPAWSKDGQSILYTSYFKTGFPDIYKINLQTNKLTPFATYKGTNTGAAFSPTGTRVAMILSSFGNNELCLADANGKSVVRLTRNKSLETAPCWSPDGTKLALVSNKLGKPQLYLALPRANTPLTHVPTRISSYCSEPTWNPVQPHLIAFTAAVNKGYQIAVYNMQTGKSDWLSNERGDAIEPEWLSDGRHLVFTNRTASNRQLKVLDTETKTSAPLHSRGFANLSQASFINLQN